MSQLLPAVDGGGWMVPPGQRERTPFAYGPRDPRTRAVEVGVLHWDAVPHTGRPEHAGGDPARLRRWGRGEARRSGTHGVAMRDGEPLQLCALHARPWHAGGSRWVNPATGRPVPMVNACSVALDVDNVGPLYRGPRGGLCDAYEWAAMHTRAGEKRPDYRRGPLRPVRRPYRGPEPYQTPDGRLWEPYTAAQCVTLLRMVQLCALAFPALQDPARWVGHSQIRQGKPDPGPCCPWPLVWAAAAAPVGWDPASIDWDAVPGVVTLGGIDRAA